MNSINTQSFGGQIIKANLLGHEIFYCPEKLLPAPTPARAGVPILFPQFSDHGPLIKHGTARLKEWQVTSLGQDHTVSSLLLTEQPDWLHRAQLSIESRIEHNHLNIHFKIHNVGNSIFEWTGGLHPYFLINDVTQTSIEGLTKNTLHMQSLKLSEQPHDMAYPSSPTIDLHSPSFSLRLEQKGFDAWMLWNPGAQHNLKDIPHDDWQRFICIEPVCLTPHTLQANEVWSGTLRISLI